MCVSLFLCVRVCVCVSTKLTRPHAPYVPIFCPFFLSPSIIVSLFSHPILRTGSIGGRGADDRHCQDGRVSGVFVREVAQRRSHHVQVLGDERARPFRQRLRRNGRPGTIQNRLRWQEARHFHDRNCLNSSNAGKAFYFSRYHDVYASKYFVADDKLYYIISLPSLFFFNSKLAVNKGIIFWTVFCFT